MLRSFSFGMMLLVAGCGGPTRSASTVPTVVTLRWRVDRVTHAHSGADIDDGPIYVSLVIEETAATVRAGRGVGWCSTEASSPTGKVCTPMKGSILHLSCGGDPHVDRVRCFDAVQTGAKVTVILREYDVPAVDGAPPPPTLLRSEDVGELDVPKEASWRPRPTEHRDVEED